ncbi:MAG TPA: radical SAM protein [Thermoanaerobaculia bacterium]|jgi:MoaA/NifB/PqqE/SkfB family radical SAM enzyme|nr:radical SAM protein [Thermoanaerobaculia bacterium]
MSFAGILSKAWRDNLLFSVLVELTYRCNLDCFFCYNDLGLRGEPLTTEQYLRFFEDLRDLQVMNLTLSGGEPLAHPDFLKLGARARQLGFVVRVKSNGHALHGEMARRLRDEVDPFLVELSLHGANAATHDRQTRVPGSFERLLANLREVLDLGIRVKINSTLTRWNENEAEGMLDLAAGLGLPIQIDPEVTPRDDGDREPLSIAPTREGVRRLFALQAAGSVAVGPDDGTVPVPVEKHCGAGSAGIAVDPFGNVYPCVQWRRSVGNLHRQSIREIWTGSADLQEVRGITAEAKRVVEGYGPSGAFLNFCPGSAAVRTGDPLQVYPEAELRMEETVRAMAGKKALLPIVQ